MEKLYMYKYLTNTNKLAFAFALSVLDLINRLELDTVFF